MNINNDGVYTYKELLSLEDSFPINDRETLGKITKSAKFSAVQRLIVSGLNPVIGGTLKISEITYTGVASLLDSINGITPTYTIMPFELLVYNYNGTKYFVTRVNSNIGLGQTPIILSNLILISAVLPVSEIKYEALVVPLSDNITNLTVGTTKEYFDMPFDATLTSVFLSLLFVQTGGSLLTVDINRGGTSILSTKLTISNNALNSSSAIAQPVFVTPTITLSKYDRLTFDIDNIGTVGAKGAKVTLILQRT
jgi:hypothetical protein